MLPSCDLSVAHQIAEDIRGNFKAAAPGIVQGVLRPTASFGIAVATGPEELEALLDRADQALYQAKREGRDCVRLLEQRFNGKLSVAG